GPGRRGAGRAAAGPRRGTRAIPFLPALLGCRSPMVRRCGRLEARATPQVEVMMPVLLNHTIVWVRDKAAAASSVASLLGLAEPTPYGRFLVLALGNDVSLDFADSTEPIHPQHYAFLVGESDFDAILGRIRDRTLRYWADPGRHRPEQINTN